MGFRTSDKHVTSWVSFSRLHLCRRNIRLSSLFLEAAGQRSWPCIIPSFLGKNIHTDAAQKKRGIESSKVISADCPCLCLQLRVVGSLVSWGFQRRRRHAKDRPADKDPWERWDVPVRLLQFTWTKEETLTVTLTDTQRFTVCRFSSMNQRFFN